VSFTTSRGFSKIFSSRFQSSESRSERGRAALPRKRLHRFRELGGLQILLELEHAVVQQALVHL
jgi:hypothetical protein